ncbi:MAG: hypothetical protein U0768_00885 [Anaerolineae bacterium]
MLLCLAGCAAEAAPAPDSSASGAPALLVSPTGLTLPMPRADAERVFRWPQSGRPSLIFVYDDGAT